MEKQSKQEKQTSKNSFITRCPAEILPLIKKQAGNGVSRRNIQGSKIAKGHQSFKVFSSTALKKFFLKKSLTTPKKIERGTLWDFSIPSLSQNPKKIEGETLWGKIFSRKKSHNAEKN